MALNKIHLAISKARGEERNNTSNSTSGEKVSGPATSQPSTDNLEGEGEGDEATSISPADDAMEIDDKTDARDANDLGEGTAQTGEEEETEETETETVLGDEHTVVLPDGAESTNLDMSRDSLVSELLDDDDEEDL